MTILTLSALRRNGGTQPRAALRSDWTTEYAADMTVGAVFPPVVVFFDGADYWLADGFHRVAAAESIGRTEIEADVRQGAQRDAILYSVGANAIHGQRRTNEDKRRAVLTLLNDPEWAKWSDQEIARRCAVDGKTVAAHRPARPSSEIPKIDEARTVRRGGTTYVQHTVNIGRRTAPTPEAKAIVHAATTGYLATQKQFAKAPEAHELQAAIDDAVHAAMGPDALKRAANTVKRDEKQAVKVQRQAEIETKAAAVPAIADRYELHHASFTDGRFLPPAASVDIIVTDPPYPAEFLHLFDGLGYIAAHVLKPGALAVVMVGQTYLPDIIASLSKHLTYHWTLAYLTPGGQAAQQFQRHVIAFWKPVLVFSNGAYDGAWFADVAKSDPNDNDKDHHHWGQSASGMRDLMRRFVRPGDTVLDPFLGGGTTGVVALELGARFIGFDIDENAITTTKARIGGMNAALVA